MVGACESGNQLSVCVKRSEFFEQRRKCQILEKGSASWNWLVLVCLMNHCALKVLTKLVFSGIFVRNKGKYI